MAVKARAEITLSSIRDIQSVTRYYLLQSSTSAAPAKPTTNPPGGSWATSEPTYTSGSTNSLYFTDCTVFSDGTFVYSDVSLSSSYEAAKVAYNKAENAEAIAERATHSPNLTPFGSRSFADAVYWVDPFYIGTNGSKVVFNAEQLEDGWIHVTIDPTNYTGTAAYVGDQVRVAPSPSIKPGGLYTILYEVRNNKSTIVSSGTNSIFYIQQVDRGQFYGQSIVELLEGTGGAIVYLRDAITTNGIHRHRFTQYADDGTHHYGEDPRYFFTMMFRAAKEDILDFEVRISVYEGRYLGDYMPYIVSDTTELETDIKAAQDTANGKNTVYYQTSAPSGGTYKTNDIWFDTNNGNKMYMWNGSAWTPEQFGNAAISDLAITNAKIANGTIESAKISNLDAGKVTSGTMSAARIKGDELKLGGDNNTDGVMKVYNADGELVGAFTKEGLEVIAGTIAGWTINPGELYTDWNQSTRTYKARLSSSSGLKFEETDSETGFEQFLRQVIFGAENIAFLHRDRDGFQTAGFIRGIEGTAPGSSVDGGISISPNLLVTDGDGAIYADQLRISTIVNGSYIRQPQLIMSGKTTISGGTAQKRATICAIPTEYQSGWLIVPFVTRTYGNSGVAPADNGDFYYAYYNSADHEVDIKLANLLPSGVVFTFDYLIYAVPES